jgi:hypothetical protein
MCGWLLGFGLAVLDLRGEVEEGSEGVVVEVGAFARATCAGERGAIVCFDRGCVWGYEVEHWSETLRCARWVDANFWPGLSSATSG